jgi:hypothetical protein
MDRMDRQQLLEELAQEISDRNHAYKRSLEIIQAAKPAKKVNKESRYYRHRLALFLIFTGTLLAIVDAEAADLIGLTKAFICMCWHWIFSLT